MVGLSATKRGAQRADSTYRLARLETGRQAEKRLHGSDYHALQQVRCSFDGGVLVLTGRLPSYYLKQMAQETVATLPGIVQVVNAIEVVSGR
jgi:hypothetical protein